jgi:hypothetical protein
MGDRNCQRDVYRTKAQFHCLMTIFSLSSYPIVISIGDDRGANAIS